MMSMVDVQYENDVSHFSRQYRVLKHPLNWPSAAVTRLDGACDNADADCQRNRDQICGSVCCSGACAFPLFIPLAVTHLGPTPVRNSSFPMCVVHYCSIISLAPCNRSHRNGKRGHFSSGTHTHSHTRAHFHLYI